MRHLLSIVFGAAFTGAACWAMGRLAFRQLGIRLARLEHDLLGALTGAALFSLLIFLLCVTHAVYTPVLLLLGAGIIFLGWRYGARSEGELPPASRSDWIMIGLPGVLYAVVYLSNSLAPEISPDGASYHLGEVYRYYRMHGFDAKYVTLFSTLSQGVEMLFLFAFSFGRQSSAATFHLLFLPVLAALMILFGRRFSLTAAAFPAAAMVFLSPVVGVDASSAYNDVALMTCGFGVFYLVELWREQRTDALLTAAGLLAGFCYAIKYTGGIALLWVILVILWERRPRQFLAASAASALLILPWVIRNALWTGNPVAPFFNRWFPNPWIHVSMEELTRAYFRTYDVKDWADIPLMLTVTGQLGGQLGPWFLGLPIVAAALDVRWGRRLLLAALIFGLTYPTNIGARFLLPVLPFIAFAMAIAFHMMVPARWRQSATGGLILFASLVAWPGMTAGYEKPGNWRISQIPWKAALGSPPTDTWLLQHSAGWVTARMLDHFVPKGKKVWSSPAVLEGHAFTDVRVNFESAHAESAEDLLLTAFTADQQPVWRWRFDFTPRTTQRIRLFQRADIPAQWSVAEMRLYSGGTAFAVADSSAGPFPWDSRFAFDGAPITRWRTWQRTQPGDWLEARLAKPATIDAVEVDLPPAPREISLAMEGIDARVTKQLLPDATDLRPAATQAMKARGYDFILLGDDHAIAAEVRANPSRWGVDLIADRGGDRLYRIR